MSTYFKLYTETISAPDPDLYIPSYGEVVARNDDGEPVVQGREIATLTWAVMSLSDFLEIRAKWTSNDGASGSHDIPPLSGDSWTSWRTVTGHLEAPTGEYRGNNIQNVVVRIVIP